MKKCLLGLLGMVSPVASSSADDGYMFGVTLPPETVVFAVEEGGGYMMYAVSGSDMPPLDEEAGETWADYLGRVNIQQGLPSGFWFPEDFVYESHVGEAATEAADSPVVVFEFGIGWGCFSGPVGDLLIVGRFSEFQWVPPDGEGTEEGTARVFTAIGYPETEQEAAELMARRMVGDFPEDSGNPSGSPKPSLPVSSLVMVIAYPGGSAIGGDNPVPGGNQNAAGLLCVQERNERDRACDQKHADDHMDCVVNHGACHGVVIGACLAVGAFCPPCGLGCVGSGMIACAVATADCREAADNGQDSCRSGSEDLYDVCCMQEGTECGLE